MDKIEIATCPLSTYYCLDLSRGLANYELKAVLRGPDFVPGGPSSRLFARNRSNLYPRALK